MESCVGEFKTVSLFDSFAERNAEKTEIDAGRNLQKNESRLHSFGEEYERLQTVLIDGMAVMDARMTQNET